MEKQTYSLGKGIVFRDYKDFGVVVNIPLRKNIILNASASKILSLVKGKITKEKLIEKIKSSNKLSKTKQKDIEGILLQFKKQKIIKVIKHV